MKRSHTLAALRRAITLACGPALKVSLDRVESPDVRVGLIERLARAHQMLDDSSEQRVGSGWAAGGQRHDGGNLRGRGSVRKTPEAGQTRTPEQSPVVPGSSLPVGWEEFWERYPRKIGKKVAARAWAKLTPEERAHVLADLADRPQADPQWQKDDGAFIPHPATYLNGRRWTDEWRTPEVLERARVRKLAEEAEA